jgi:predicted O-methyltransferase YrrM
MKCRDRSTHGWEIDVTGDGNERVARVRAVRRRLADDGPPERRPIEGDVERVALPAAEADALRDALIADGARVVIEIGLAYASSALAIAEALLVTGDPRAQHVVIDPFQQTAYSNAGWRLLHDAGVATHTTLLVEPSSAALPRLLGEGLVADAAFVDGSHRFHEVFLDLYFLRKLIRPGGLIILDDIEWPSVASALHYYDRNLGWEPVDIAGRLAARRLPETRSEPAFTQFKPF